ncbi:14523_t:CDS:2, partial [Acaulospora colombiana]
MAHDEDFLAQRTQSLLLLDSTDDDLSTLDAELSNDNDDWQWEERLRLINDFSNWTSGNSGLDQFIQQTQLENPDQKFHMRWIDYKDNFSNVKLVAEGGHSSVFSATWLNKTDQVWDGAKQAFVEKPLVVALKVLKDSQNLSYEFLDEFKRHASLKLDGCGYMVHCHGVSRHPETNEYIVVMNFAEEGDLRRYLQRNVRTLRWKDTVDILCNIAMGLHDIHKNGTFHKNLHCGNVMKFYNCYIADFGLCGPSNSSAPRGVYGSLPFVAPEVLAGGTFSAKADIYSFAFIMWELSSGREPFSDRPHDHSLALEICHGFRESVMPGTPLFYEKLMRRCWDADPSKRPDAEEIVDILSSPYEYQCQLLGIDELGSDGINELESFDQTLASKMVDQKDVVKPKKHPFAFYTSKFLLFPNLPEPRNQDKVEPVVIVPYSNAHQTSQDEDEVTYEEYDTNCPLPPESY